MLPALGRYAFLYQSSILGRQICCTNIIHARRLEVVHAYNNYSRLGRTVYIIGLLPVLHERANSSAKELTKQLCVTFT